MTASYGSCRVSTTKQLQGSSLEAQETMIRAYCVQKDLPSPTIFVDRAEQASVPFADRPGGAEIIARLKSGDHVCFTTIDRGFRNLGDFLIWFDAWKQTGVHLHVIDVVGCSIDYSTPMGEFLFKLFALLAEWEKGQISERVNKTHRLLRAQGKRHTPMGVPIGFKPVKDPKGKGFFIVPDPVQRALMGQIYTWWTVDGKSHWAIFQHLRASKVPPPGKRKEWTQQCVQVYCQKERELREKEAQAQGTTE